MEKAKDVIRTMNEAEMVPGADTYTILMCGYATHGRIADIQKTFNQCHSDGISFDEQHLCDILHQLISSGYEDQIDWLLAMFDQHQDKLRARIRLILKLVNENQRELAFTILKTLPMRVNSGQIINSGHHFLTSIVRNNCHYDEMLSYVKRLVADGRHSDPHMELLYLCLKYQRQKEAIRLLHNMKLRSIPIEQLYFWPLFCSSTSNEQIIDLLKMMMIDFDCDVSIETLKDYVIPNLKGMSIDSDIMDILCGIGISKSKAVISTSLVAIQNNDLRLASKITTEHPTFLKPEIFRQPLQKALNANNDIDNYINIIRNIYNNFQLEKSTSSDRDENTGNDTLRTIGKSDVLGMIIFDALLVPVGNERYERAIRLFRGCIAKGMYISKYEAERIRQLLGARMPDALANELDQVTQKQSVDAKYRTESSNDTDLETAGNLKRPLLTKPHTGNGDSLTKQKTEPKSNKSATDDNIHTSLMKIYKENGNTFNAHEALRQTKHLMNKLAKAGRTNEVATVFEFLTDDHTVKVTEDLADPLVMAHLTNEDIDGAIDAFERVYKKYLLTPSLHALQCALINAEETDKLNRIHSLSCEAHKRWNALLTLTISYIECGRKEDAIETMSQANDCRTVRTGDLASLRLLQCAKRFYENDQDVALNVLFEVASAFPNIQRHKIFDYLVRLRCKDKTPERALDLWTRAQQEQIALNAETKKRLKNYLSTFNIGLPEYASTSQR